MATKDPEAKFKKDVMTLLGKLAAGRKRTRLELEEIRQAIRKMKGGKSFQAPKKSKRARHDDDEEENDEEENDDDDTEDEEEEDDDDDDEDFL